MHLRDREPRSVQQGALLFTKPVEQKDVEKIFAKAARDERTEAKEAARDRR